MTEPPVFQGFGPDCLNFLAELGRHNDRDWFRSQRDRYETHLMAPARALVVALGERLEMLSPGIHAEPKVNRSLFRISRDTRFSRDKSPYKTHLGLWFWEGPGQRMDCSGFYFHLGADSLFLGAGIYCFSQTLLKEFRRSLSHPRHAPALSAAAAEVTARGFTVKGRHYKRPPRGLEPDPALAELALHNGLYASALLKPPPQLYSAELVDFCLGHFVDLNPLHRWLVDLTRRAEGSVNRGVLLEREGPP